MAYNPGGSHRGSGDPRFGGGGRSGGRSFGGGGGYGGGRGGDRGSRGPMEMHQATCADCGKSCEVPFRPSGTKPVFCSSCFKAKDNGGDRGGRDFERRDNDGGGRRSYGNRDYGDRGPAEMHQAVCTDCGKDCEVPFKPTGDKPIFCDKCFGRNKEIKTSRPGGGNANNADINAKFEMLSIKLDRILKALDATASHKSNKEVSKDVKDVKEPKVVKTFEAPKAEKEAKEVKEPKEAKIPATKTPETASKSVIKKTKSAKAKVKKAKA